LGKKNSYLQSITSLGAFIVLITISFSSSKLPHYLNSLFPIMSIGATAYIYGLHNIKTREQFKIITVWNIIFTVILVLCICLIGLISFWSFGFPHIGILVICLVFIAVTIFCLLQSNSIKRLFLIGVFSICSINILLNTHFYPNLLKFQSGITVAHFMAENHIPSEHVVRFGKKHSWSLDFYNKTYVPSVDASEIKNLKDNQWLFIYSKDFEILKANNAFSKDVKTHEFDHFRITRLNLKFLNPNKRENELNKTYLIQAKYINKS
jgi:hypothetical protein